MSGTQLLPPERITPAAAAADVVVFPHMVIPLFVGRPKSIKALEAAMEGGKHIMLVAQKTAAKDEPTEKDMYEVGCIANILQMLKLPDGTVKVLVEGLQRAKALSIEEQETQFSCEVMPLEPDHADSAETGVAPRDRVAVRPVREAEQEDPAGDPDVAVGHRRSRPPGRHHRRASAAQARAEAGHPRDVPGHRASRAPARAARGEIDILQVEKRIRGRVKRQMEKSQREYYLNEQVKAIQKELGEGEDGADLEELEKRSRPRACRRKPRRRPTPSSRSSS
jgi:ATP-dependent Lon protease